MNALPRCPNVKCQATLGTDGVCHVCALGAQPMEDPRLAWDVFVASRPNAVQKTIAKYKLAPNRYYKLSETGDDYYQLYSVSDDGSEVSVIRYDAASHEPRWRVFGIDPAELIFWRERPWADFTREG